MRKKKKILNLALLLSLGVGTFGPNVNVVFAQDSVDEIVLEGDESQTTERSDENAEEEFELEIPDSEELSESISIDAVESKSEIQGANEIHELENSDENDSSNQPAFYSNSDFEIKNGVLVKYHGNAATVTIPSSVTSIGEEAFSKTDVVNVTIPDSVKTIGKRAFAECANLEKISVGNGVTEIPDLFTYWCKNLKSVKLGNKVSSTGYGSFSCCYSLSEIVIPSTLTKIGQYSFSNCHILKSIDLKSVKTIEEGAFLGCGFVNIDIPDSVKYLGDRTFDSCSNLKKISIGKGIEEIPIWFARWSDLETVEIRGNNLKSIGSGAFYECLLLANVSMPDSVKVIDTSSFAHLPSLKKIRLPKNLQKIGNGAFQGTALQSVTIPDQVTEIDCQAFSLSLNLTDVYLPYSINSLEGDYSSTYANYPSTFTGYQIFNESPNVTLHIYSDHQYAINYAKKHNIKWKSRGLYNVQKPKTVKAESVGKNKVRLSWSKASGADKYLVQCWRNGKLQYKYTTKNNYLTDPKASDTASNTYKVYSRMTRADGTVVYSSQPAVVSSLGVCPRVTNVRANSTTSGGQIKWNKSYYNDGYIIYRSVNKNGTGAVYAGTTRDVKFTDKKAKKGQLYYYWVYPYHNKNGKMILGEKPAESPRAKMK